MEEGLIHGGVAFIADYQAAVVAQPGEGALDLPALAVTAQLSPILGLGASTVGAVRTDQLNAAFGEGLPEGVGIIGAVGNQPCRPSRRLDGVEGGLSEGDLGRRGRGKLASQRKTLAVDHHHPLGAFAPLGFSHPSAPPLAGAKLASRKASCQSKLPFSSSWARKVRHTPNHTSSSSQRRSRRQQVEGLGYSSGRSAHGAPVRSIHKIPSSTSRLARQGRPPFAPTLGVGSRGPIRSHIASVKNCRRAMGFTSHDSIDHIPSHLLDHKVMK